MLFFLCSRPPRPSSVSRRTRSASPAVMESTLTAVQAALNRRQLQVHGLRAKLANSEQASEHARKTARAKAEALDAAERRLEAERSAADALRVR